MQGNRVRVVRDNGKNLEGTLHKLDERGAIVWDGSVNSGNIFIPMARIVEIIDLGPANRF